MNCRDWEPYNVFQKLKAGLSVQDLVKLTTHKNNALRMFAAQDVILTGQADVSALFVRELKKDATVIEQNGCSVGPEMTYNLVYHTYWNK